MQVYDPQRFDQGDILDIGLVARVYKAKDRQDDESKALKIYSQSWNPEHFEYEVKLYRRLQNEAIHVNIMRFYEAFTRDDEKILLLEYCDGGNLRQILHKARDLRDPTPIEPANRDRWLKEIMQGLKFLHDNGIIHRDIHPRNILLKDGKIKIGDFRVVQIAKVGGMTRLGSLRYRSPEVCNMLNSPDLCTNPNHSPHSSAADIWSFGCILYEMYTLNRVIQQRGDVNILNELFDPQFRIPVLASGQAALDALYRQMLSRNPELRPTADRALEIL